MSRRGGAPLSSSRGGRLSSAASSHRGTPDPSSSSSLTSTAAPVGGTSSARNAASSIHGASSIIGAGGARQKDPSGRIVEWKSSDDKCPVCKTDRYLNPSLRLLVGPCYHKMCESCIDRIFALGPAPCPVCGRTCRKNQFGFQTFEDLQVEREVALRRIITKKCARSFEQDFSGDLKAYNDYLDQVESATFQILHGPTPAEEEAGWKWVNGQEAANRNAVASHAREVERESELARRVEEMERDARRGKAERLRALEEQERREKEREDRMLVEMLEKGQVDAEEVQRRRKEGARRWAKERDRLEREIEREFEEKQQEKLGDLLSAVASAARGRKRKADDNAPDAAEGGANKKLYGLLGYRPEMLQDFQGPLAALTDERSLLPSKLLYVPSSSDARPSPSTIASASTRLLGKIGSKQGANASKEELVRMEAGGYDWKMALGRDHQAALMTLGFRTSGVEDLLAVARS